MPNPKLHLWNDFTATHRIREDGVPLFATTTEGRVLSAPMGKTQRPMLQRSAEMESLVIALAERVLASQNYDGILYMMHRRESDRIVPLYIGRAGKHGRIANHSANLLNLSKDRSKFARWGSNYAYHIGDLSAAACPNHDPKKIRPKYTRWAARLFEDCPSPTPRLRHPIYYWATAWGPSSLSIWREYGESSISFQEYLPIGVASDLFPDALLNDEGVNRAGPEISFETPGPL